MQTVTCKANQAKLTKRIGHKIGVGLIVLMLAFIFWTQISEDNALEMIMAFLSIILFLTFGFTRLYQYFRLEKARKRTDEKDFVNFLDGLTFLRLMPHVVIPYPVGQQAVTIQERKIKKRINVLTVLVWVFFGLTLFILSKVN